MKTFSPKDCPIIHIPNSREFDNILGLEKLVKNFPHSNRNVGFVKKSIDNGNILLVMQSQKGPIGYFLCDPKQKHSPTSSNYGFYITERKIVYNGKGDNIILLSRMLDAATEHAVRLGRGVMYEEVNIYDHEYMRTSYALGFRSIHTENRGPREVYVIMRKPLTKQRQSRALSCSV